METGESREVVCVYVCVCVCVCVCVQKRERERQRESDFQRYEDAWGEQLEPKLRRIQCL